jgi:hypothetical protein
MLLSNKIRVVGVALLTIVIMGWLWICDFLLEDYFAILNQAPTVRLSVITLWVPVGVLGVLLSMLFISPKALFLGKK